MKSILEALADNRLRVFDDAIEQTKEFRELKAQLDSCEEKWLKKAGQDRRPQFEQLLSIIFEQHQFIEKDTFLYGFRFGMLSTIEVFVHKDMLIAPIKENKKTLESEKQDAYHTERFFRKSILGFLSEDAINATNPERLKDKRNREIDKHFNEYWEAVFGVTADDKNPDVLALDNDLYEIGGSMLEIKKTSRFIYGYSIGVLMITEVFQDRDKLIAIPDYDDYLQE